MKMALAIFMPITIMHTKCTIFQPWDTVFIKTILHKLPAISDMKKNTVHWLHEVHVIDV
jgi:hypothetical protein